MINIVTKAKKAIQVLRGEYIISPEIFIEKLLGTKKNVVRHLFREIKNNKEFNNSLEEKRKYIESVCSKEKNEVSGGISLEQCQILYVITRIVEPANVLETGVANGFSTAYILKALRRNQRGTLYSIDFPIKEEAIIPEDKSSGWVVPEELRKQWSLETGKVSDLLMQILEKINKLDMFFHDSLHTYQNMFWEFENVWVRLQNNGYLLSHDIGLNSAWEDFCKKVNVEEVKLREGMGGLKKD